VLSILKGFDSNLLKSLNVKALVLFDHCMANNNHPAENGYFFVDSYK
jgi:hypothetical protein